MILFHGGVAGLEVGDTVRPALSVGMEHARSPNQPNYNPNRVYVTRLEEYARLFAVMCDGDVYEVRPFGRPVRDPDARGSFSCGSARVIRVVERGVRMPERARRLLLG